MTCCCCLQEAFTTAKLAFANYKMRIRSNLASTHLGPETLEEAVQESIQTMAKIEKDTAVAEETKVVVQKEEAQATEKAKETQAIAGRC